MKKIVKLFRAGNVLVTGLRGRGKDMLIANVVIRRKLPYVSNVNYGGEQYPLNLNDFDCGRNTYKNFIANKIIPYYFPYPDGTDIYISDAGIYFPSQYCSELNRDYGYFSTFMALSRQLGECNVHINVQNLNRCWDKIREQSDIYITCNRCIVLFGKFVCETVTIYDKYESCLNRVPPFKPPKVRLNNDRKLTLALTKQNYEQTHGKIQRRRIFFVNKSTYDTRVFKKMLEVEVEDPELDDLPEVVDEELPEDLRSHSPFTLDTSDENAAGKGNLAGKCRKFFSRFRRAPAEEE